MRYAVLLSISLLAMDHAAGATDLSTLKGSYGSTGSESCLISPTGFNSSLQALGDSWSSSGHVEGVRTFDGAGKGTVKGRAMTLTAPLPTTAPSFLPNASSDEFSFSFTYTVKDDVWHTALVAGTYAGTILTGPDTGETYTIDEVFGTGLISADAKQLTLANLEPVVQTIKFYKGTTLVKTLYRICQRSRVFIKLDTD